MKIKSHAILHAATAAHKAGLKVIHIHFQTQNYATDFTPQSDFMVALTNTLRGLGLAFFPQPHLGARHGILGIARHKADGGTSDTGCIFATYINSTLYPSAKLKRHQAFDAKLLTDSFEHFVKTARLSGLKEVRVYFATNQTTAELANNVSLISLVDQLAAHHNLKRASLPQAQTGIVGHDHRTQNCGCIHLVPLAK